MASATLTLIRNRMNDLAQIRDNFIIPALTTINHAEPAAIRLVLGTGLIESNYEFLTQQGGGPALGYWQMEPATCNYLWDGFMPKHPTLLAAMTALLGAGNDRINQLVLDSPYAAAMCRVKYLSIPAPLPSVDDLGGMAAYWLKYYNAGGKGDSGVFIERANSAGLMKSLILGKPMKRYITAMLLLAILTGCSTISSIFPAPQTPSETVIAADAAVTAAAATAKAYESAGIIKSGSPTEKAISAALTTAQTALNNANADIQAGKTNEVTLLTDVALGVLTGVNNALTQAKSNSTLPTP